MGLKKQIDLNRGKNTSRYFDCTHTTVVFVFKNVTLRLSPVLSVYKQVRNHLGQRWPGAHILEIRERFCYCDSGHHGTIWRMGDGAKLVSSFFASSEALAPVAVGLYVCLYVPCDYFL